MERKILIVEDEMIVAEDLSDFLRSSGYNICGIAISGDECFELINAQRPDLLILDIHLKGNMDGVEIMELLNGPHKIPIVVITANSDDRLLEKIIPLQPAAYISKPFNRRDVKIALDLALNKFSPGGSQMLNGQPDCFYVKDGRQYRKIELSAIQFIEARGSYSEIRTDDRTYTISYNLSYLLRQISHPMIKKVHRSFVVNLSKVTGFDSNSLFIQKTPVPVSRQYRKELSRLFKRI